MAEKLFCEIVARLMPAFTGIAILRHHHELNSDEGS